MLNRVDRKLLELKTFARVIDSCDDRKELMRKLNGVKSGFERNSQFRNPRLSIWGDLIRKYK